MRSVRIHSTIDVYEVFKRADDAEVPSSSPLRRCKDCTTLVMLEFPYPLNLRGTKDSRREDRPFWPFCEMVSLSKTAEMAETCRELPGSLE